MEDAQRWSAMFTKHVKQKRKVYQDGFLELPSSGNKVMLFDEWDKLLESRFVKKDDVIRPGETLSFDSYLVDIGELCGGKKPTATVNCQEKEKKLPEKSGPLHSYNSQNRKPTFGKIKGRVINLSPSQKMIRDFKKSEINKCGSSPNCVDVIRTSTTEWQVLYTTHVTQKAKKFHDGYLQLVVRGSQGRQVKLYDTNRRHLDSRFLKKDELVCSGESLAFEGYLVEIGEEEGDHKPVAHSTLQGKTFTLLGKTDIADHQARIPTNKKFSAVKLSKVNDSSPKLENAKLSWRTYANDPRRAGHPDETSTAKLTKINDSSPKIENPKLSWTTSTNEPRRAVHDILSILRQPIQRKVVQMNKLLVEVEGCLESHASDVPSDIKDHTIEYAEEISGSTHEDFSGNTSDNYCKIKILKPEAVEVCVAAEKCTVSENERESQAKSSSFFLRSGTTNCIAPILDVECIGNNEFLSSPSSLEHHTKVTTALDSSGQKPIESAIFTKLNKNEGLENHPEIGSCEDITNETNAAAKNGLSSSKLPELLEDSMGSSCRLLEPASSLIAAASNECELRDLSSVEEKALKQGFNKKVKDEFPSFDLGF